MKEIFKKKEKVTIKKIIVWGVLNIILIGAGIWGFNHMNNDFAGRFGSVYLSDIKKNVVEYDKVSNNFMEKFSAYVKTTDKNFEYRSVCDTYELLVSEGLMQKSENEFVNKKMCYSYSKDTPRTIVKDEKGEYKITPEFTKD